MPFRYVAKPIGSHKKMSILDNDLYKFSMQQAVLKLYPDIYVKYAYRNRSPQTHQFTPEAFKLLEQKINALKGLRLSKDEIDWLAKNCPYFEPSYLKYLESFVFDPSEQIFLEFIEDEDTRLGKKSNLYIVVYGKWVDTILYEVPIMSLVSETYFQTIDTDWDYEHQYDQAYKKGSDLLITGCEFSEFGTRRRRDFHTQEIVIQALVAAEKDYHQQQNNPNAPTHKGSFLGTSNVYFAKKYNLQPIGTVAHEWTMAISVLEKDIKHANRNALLKWSEAYPPHYFHIALTDTYMTKPFFDDFDLHFAQLYAGLRQDSGDPIIFLKDAVHHYNSLGIDPSKKVIVFSDSLNYEKCVDILKHAQEINGPRALFGIGTYFTNDFCTKSSNYTAKSKAMNIVIKLSQCNGIPVVKLSDDPNKHHGGKTAVEEVLKIFELS